MGYEDFKLNPQDFEKMAKEFGQMQKVESLEDEENSITINEREANFIDLIIGFKIFERLLFSCKDRCKNNKIIGFAQEKLGEIEKMEKAIAPLGEEPLTNEIDFEFPSSDGQIIKMMQNLTLSITCELCELWNFEQDLQNRSTIVGIIELLTALAKEIINLLD